MASRHRVSDGELVEQLILGPARRGSWVDADIHHKLSETSEIETESNDSSTRKLKSTSKD